MTESNYITKRLNKNNHFGGIIYPSDFDTDHRKDNCTTGSLIAARIEADRRWEKKLLQNYAKKGTDK